MTRNRMNQLPEHRYHLVYRLTTFNDKNKSKFGGKKLSSALEYDVSRVFVEFHPSDDAEEIPTFQVPMRDNQPVVANKHLSQSQTKRLLMKNFLVMGLFMMLARQER